MKHLVLIFSITAILLAGCAKKNMIIVMSDQKGQTGELQLNN